MTNPTQPTVHTRATVVADPLGCFALLIAHGMPQMAAVFAAQVAAANNPAPVAYQADEASARAARRAAYTSGVVTPKAKPTADERAKAEANKWGLS